MRKRFPKMLPNSLIYGSNALEIPLQSDQKCNLQIRTKISDQKTLLYAMGGNPVHFFVQLCTTLQVYSIPLRFSFPGDYRVTDPSSFL